MEDLRRENGGLQAEINRLNDKLQESLVGLQAATRLGDQLETKTAQINDLKEQGMSLTFKYDDVVEYVDTNVSFYFRFFCYFCSSLVCF